MANEDKRIIELPASTSILNDDWIAKDSASQDTTRLQLSFLKQLCGGNNFAGEWQSGTTFVRDAYVIHEGKLYHNISGGGITQLSWSASPWQEINVSDELKKLAGDLANTFNKNSTYTLGDYVVYNNQLYKCTTTHSGAWNEAHFTAVTTTGLINDVVTQLNNVKEQIYANIASTFSSSAQYSINDFVIYNNQLYICRIPHHGSWDATDFTLVKIGDALEFIFNNNADVYSLSGSYVKGDVVNYLGMLLRCIVDTATSPMVVSEWEQVTVAQLINENKVNDVQIAGQTTVDENKISDLTSLAIEGTASGDIATFNDGSNLPMKSFVANIKPIQDFHGFDTQWVGGVGKNKLPLTLDNIKTINTNGTWDGDIYTAPTGIVFNFTTNTEGSITSIKANGPSSSSNTTLYLQRDITNSIYPDKMLLSGCPSGGGGSTYKIRCQLQGTPNTTIVDEFGDGAKFAIPNDGNNYQVIIRIQSGVTADNLMFYPMICSVESSTTFEPYSNICAISGITRCWGGTGGKNLADLSSILKRYPNGPTATSNPNTIRSSSNTRSFVLMVKPNTTYTISKKAGAIFRLAYTEEYPDETGMTCFGYKADNTAALIKTTAPSNARYMMVVVWTASSDTIPESEMLNSVQIEMGDTQTEYEKFTGSSYFDITFPVEAGIVYHAKLDVNRGKLRVTHKEITFDGATEGKMFTNKGGGSNNYYLGLYDGYLFGKSESGWVTVDEMKEQEMINSHYDYCPNVNLYTGLRAYVGDSARNLQPRLFFGSDSTITTVELANAWLAEQYANGTPWQVVYPLAEPIEYDVTPTLIKSVLGKNYAWSNAQSVDADYYANADLTPNPVDRDDVEKELETIGLRNEVYRFVADGVYGEASGDIIKITDGGDNSKVESFKIDIEPIYAQDYHGYDYPWPGGLEKNKLENMGVSQEINGITFTVNSDGSVTANGTATAEAQFPISIDTSTVYGDLYFVGCSGGSNSTYNVFMWDNTTNSRVKKWNGTTNSVNSTDGTLQEIKIVQGNTVNMDLRIVSGQTVENVTFYPMICLSTETDATFKPYSNICPIKKYESAIGCVKQKNLVGIPDTDIENQGYIVQRKPIVLKLGTYTLSWKTTATTGRCAVTYFDSDLNNIGSQTVDISSQINTITLTGIAAYMSIYVNASCDFKDIQLEEGSEASTYESYKGREYEVTFSKAGEVYKGYADLARGKLVATYQYRYFDGTESWTITSSSSGSHYITMSGGQIGTMMNGYCNYFRTRQSGETSQKGYCQFGNNNNRFYVLGAGPYYGADTQDKMRALTKGMEILYPLETPIEFDMDKVEIRTFKGYNNIYNNIGETDVTYRRDLNIFVNDLDRRLKALEES